VVPTPHYSSREPSTLILKRHFVSRDFRVNYIWEAEAVRKMDLIIQKCPRCGDAHKFTISSKLLGSPSVYLLCPNVTRFYRLTSFHFDAMPNIQVLYGDDEILDYIKHLHGEAGIEDKLSRYKSVRKEHIWPIDEFNDYLEQVLQAYVQGLFFSSMTGAVCLAERVMNRLVFKLKNHYKSSEHYKVVHNREEKLQNWDLLIRILGDWNIFDEDQTKLAKKIHKYRIDSVHYVPNYNYSENSLSSIKLVSELIDSLFSIYQRKDVFRVFEIPGEIWVKAEAQNYPLVKEFILPSCRLMGAIHQMTDEGYSEDGAIIGEMTEAEFIRQRKEYQKNSEAYHDGKTPQRFEQEVNEQVYTFIIP